MREKSKSRTVCFCTLVPADPNKSEAFNGFSQWIAFGGDGTILTNDRDEQRKIIKYNHLVANCVIFHNVFSLSRVLYNLQESGHTLDPAIISCSQPLHHTAYQSGWSLRPGSGKVSARANLPSLDMRAIALWPQNERIVVVPQLLYT
ncbi:MAG: hypothetical protein CSYNP_04068 [Syntrophus sp. SKADARSKE-3]|nr:hypothetical protein [Syntrophus sp. SKADARSKE-3]